MLKLFDLSLKLNGFPLRKANEKLSAILAIPDADYKDYIEKQKMEIANFHLQKNPFYKSLVGKQSFEKWSDLPVMKKSQLQRPLKERISEGYSAESIFVNKTSGSSGAPLVFGKDKFCHAIIWANIKRRFEWYGIDFNHSFQARFYGGPIDAFSRTKLRVRDILSNRYRFSIFDLSDSGIEKILSRFAKKKFDYINGYTNTIVLIAKYLRKRNLVLTDLCPTLKVCIVTSEMLFDDDRILLRKWLGVPIVNEYGAAELDVIAFEYPNKEWYVNSETTFVEILDADDNVVPNGTEGRIVVTSLFNKAHPFIRYEVGDYGALDEKSTPKFPILKSLIGRTNDTAILPSGKKPAGMAFYSITKKLFDDDGNVKEFVIKQTKIDTFEIEYTSEFELRIEEILRIEKVLSDYLEPNLKFQFTRQTVLERAKSGKLKQFTSLLNQPE